MFNTEYDDRIDDKDQEEFIKQWVVKKKLKEKKKRIKQQERKEWFLNLFKF